MHSPRRSVRPSDDGDMVRVSPSKAISLNSGKSHDGKSPPTMSPSRLALAQRAISPASSAERGLAAAHPAEGFLHIEQADIVLAALADDDAVAPLGGIGDDALRLLVDLALQVLGVG